MNYNDYPVTMEVINTGNGMEVTAVLRHLHKTISVSYRDYEDADNRKHIVAVIQHEIRQEYYAMLNVTMPEHIDRLENI